MEQELAAGLGEWQAFDTRVRRRPWQMIASSISGYWAIGDASNAVSSLSST
jgi:hypothetical protein